MFNSTHTLLGITLARAGLDRLTPWAAAVAAVAANFPDVDLVVRVYGPSVYLASHRGYTHSLPGILLLSVVLAALIYALNAGLARWRGPAVARVRFRPLLLVVLISMLTHPLLDYTNSYGIRCWLPFSSRWYAADWVFVVSIYMDAGLLAGVLLTGRRSRRRRQWAAGALVFVVAFWTVCWLSHRQAQRLLAASTVDGEAPVATAAFPVPLSLSRWDGVVETPTALYKVPISCWDSPGDLRPVVRAPKPPPSAIIERSRAAYSVKVFLDFARFPVAQVARVSEGYRVIWTDLRFYSPRLHQGFIATVRLSPALEILSENFNFNGWVYFD